MRRGPNRLGALPVAAVALAFRRDGLSLAPAIPRERSADIVALFELALGGAPDVTLILLMWLD